jgi:general secretion pathway protein A
MYESYFELREKPFSIQPDPEYLYLSRRHKLAYSMLVYGVVNRAGFTVITGDVGAGKTTLVRRLLDYIPDTTNVGLMSNTHRCVNNLLEWVMLAFGQPFEYPSPVALYDALQQFLIREYSQDRRTILIIDEAQNLTPELLEELRLLSNINADKHELLQMILLGQPELRQTLNRPEMKQLAQRISSDFRLLPLEHEEVEAYIRHRLAVAGRKELLFTPSACATVARHSEGIPRRINILCDTALVYGMAEGLSLIDESVIDEVIRDRETYGVLTPDCRGPDETDTEILVLPRDV